VSEERPNITAEEYHKISRDAVLAYLRDHTTVEERKAVFKAALSEWLSERFSEFGWFSTKALGLSLFAVLIWLWLSMNGWHK